MSPIIIGLGHYSRTGKTTLAEYIAVACQRRKITAKVLPFAWKLKQICYELYGWAGHREPEYYETFRGAKARQVVLPALGMTPVELWVKFGTPAVREQVYELTWVNYVLKGNHNASVIVIPDVRFANEADAIRAAGGVLIKVVRPGFAPLDTVADQALVNFEGWDAVVGESGTLDELHWVARQIAAWCEQGGKKPLTLTPPPPHGSILPKKRKSVLTCAAQCAMFPVAIIQSTFACILSAFK